MRIGTKLMVAHLSVLLAIFVLLSLFMPRIIADLTVRSVHSELDTQARALVRTLTRRPLTPHGLSREMELIATNARVLLIDESGKVVVDSDSTLLGSQFPAIVPYRGFLRGDNAIAHFHDTGPSLVASVPVPGTELRAVVVRPLRELEKFARRSRRCCSGFW